MGGPLPPPSPAPSQSATALLGGGFEQGVSGQRQRQRVAGITEVRDGLSYFGGHSHGHVRRALCLCNNEVDGVSLSMKDLRGDGDG